jgi:hypothetical protein
MNEPDVIYLQFHGDGNPDDEGTVRDADVTWCRDQIFEHDIKYVRVEQASPVWAELSKKAKECQRSWGMGFPVISLHLLRKYWFRATGHAPKE